jgi:metallo-beta-lactamase class B
MFRVLRTLSCDIFLGAHGSYFGLEEKYAKFKAGETTAFLDPEGYKAYVAEREQTFLKEQEKQRSTP